MEKHCTMCGKLMDTWDENLNFTVDHEIGYGSKYDCHSLHIDLCCDCLDKVVDFIVANSANPPVTECDWL